jgi:hypothetical protein
MPVGRASSLLETALLPLQAYQEEMGRQISLGREKNEAEGCLETVRQGFRTGIEDWAGGGEKSEGNKKMGPYSYSNKNGANLQVFLANPPNPPLEKGGIKEYFKLLNE